MISRLTTWHWMSKLQFNLWEDDFSHLQRFLVVCSSFPIWWGPSTFPFYIRMPLGGVLWALHSHQVEISWEKSFCPLCDTISQQASWFSGFFPSPSAVPSLRCTSCIVGVFLGPWISPQLFLHFDRGFLHWSASCKEKIRWCRWEKHSFLKMKLT